MYLGLFDISQLFLTDASSDVNLFFTKCRVARRIGHLKSLELRKKTKKKLKSCVRKIGDVNSCLGCLLHPVGSLSAFYGSSCHLTQRDFEP